MNPFHIHCTYQVLVIRASQALIHTLRIIDIPFPTPREAQIALRSLAIDQELSKLVQRDFELSAARSGEAISSSVSDSAAGEASDEKTGLKVTYKATTARMLRVAVNGFFESLRVVIQVMEELDVDVVFEPNGESLEGVQGLETGGGGETTVGAAG